MYILNGCEVKRSQSLCHSECDVLVSNIYLWETDFFFYNTVVWNSSLLEKIFFFFFFFKQSMLTFYFFLLLHSICNAIWVDWLLWWSPQSTTWTPPDCTASFFLFQFKLWRCFVKLNEITIYKRFYHSVPINVLPGDRQRRQQMNGRTTVKWRPPSRDLPELLLQQRQQFSV